MKQKGIISGILCSIMLTTLISVFFVLEFMGNNTIVYKGLIVLTLLFTLMIYRTVFLSMQRPYRELQAISVLVTSYLLSLAYSCLMSDKFYTEAGDPTVWAGVTYVLQLVVQVEVLLIGLYNIGLVIIDYALLDVLRNSTKLDSSSGRLHISGAPSSLVIFNRLSAIMYECLGIVLGLFVIWLGILLTGTLPVKVEYTNELLFVFMTVTLGLALAYECGKFTIKLDRVICRRTIGLDLLAFVAIVFNHKCMLNLTNFGWYFIKNSPIYQQYGPDGFVLSMYDIYVFMQITIVGVYLTMRYSETKDLGYGSKQKLGRFISIN